MKPPSLISDRFQLGELLGTGGSASVFDASDVENDQRVALKILHPHFAESEVFREAFFTEAERASALRHPNIVRVLGTGVDTRAGAVVAWIALERAAGVSLAEHLDTRGPLSVDGATAVARGVTRALDVAHRAGVVHRDISPSNVMIVATADGEVRVDDVRLLDFGLADAAGRAAVGADVLRSNTADHPTSVVGNISYMSPEHLRGEPVNASGDLYQTGAVLYAALTSHPPFARSTQRETMRAHLDAPPPVASVMDSRIPREIDRIIVRAMLKDPSARFSSAAEMLQAIESVTVRRRVFEGTPRSPAEDHDQTVSPGEGDRRATWLRTPRPWCWAPTRGRWSRGTRA